MVDDDTSTPTRVRWARLRFAIIGPLLSAPPDAGELWARIEELAGKSWKNPSTKLCIRFSPKTVVGSGKADPSRSGNSDPLTDPLKVALGEPDASSAKRPKRGRDA